MIGYLEFPELYKPKSETPKQVDYIDYTLCEMDHVLKAFSKRFVLNRDNSVEISWLTYFLILRFLHAT